MSVHLIVLTVEQTHNLGNYQPLKCSLSLTAGLEEGEDLSVTTSWLKLKLYEELHQIIMTGIHRHEQRLKLVAFMKKEGAFDGPIKTGEQVEEAPL